MLTAVIPLSKSGTPFQSPSWRWQATFNPEKFGLSQFLSNSTKNPNARHLSRLIPNGIKPVSVYYQPTYLKQLKSKLPSHLMLVLEKVWDKHFYLTNTNKLTFNNVDPKHDGFISWNIKLLDNINDEFFRKLIKHCYNFEGDSYIAEAIKFYKTPDNEISRKWLNYSLYSGKTDKELAIQWRKPVKFIEAVRLMFYDYSSWPKDKLVQYSLVRQLVSTGELAQDDYHLFRRIFDLGELGLRSVLGHQTFSESESLTIKEYLAESSVDILLDQRFTISSTKDIINYARSIESYANIGAKRTEMELRAALMRLTHRQMEKEMGINEQVDIYSEDTALMDYLREKMHENAKPTFPSFAEMKALN